ncbi:PRTRC genetic system protein E [Paraburkholderia fungorum]|jgi:PRTRC genetic system protein E|uniref:PRTRC system protein E n=1 Tax=Paraburkholderia fungorum TaxID=134537 RepID=UPI00160B63AB|nr:PRTRC system protein E [Paraburkholderia fungorum]MBB4518225.1 PRTRC genetic system protein E [Paraburkholderia fungorum]
MFQQLEALVRSSGKVVMTLQASGDQLAVFVVPHGATDPALRQPLVLTATAIELDEGFANALLTYAGSHKSLEEQVAVTAAILDEAKKSQVGKAQKALQGSSKKAQPAPASNSAADEDESEDEDEDEAQASDSTPALATAAPASASSEPKGTDLLSLLG